MFQKNGKFNNIHIMKRIVYLAFIALGLCACDNTEEILNETPKSPVVYHVSLQASLDAQTRGVTFDNNDESVISTLFKSSDKIYVYNETKGAFARHLDTDEEAYVTTALQPSNISTSGRGCTLEGDLTFWKLNDSDEWEEVAVDDDDTYSLFYQMNRPDYHFMSTVLIPHFDYSDQDGSATAASNCDFAEATGITMTLSTNTLTVPNTVMFNNLQSMFRQHLSFTKDNESVTPTTITKLIVGTANETLLEYYRPDRPDQDGDNGKYWAFDGFDIDDPVITDGYIYLSLAFYYTTDNPATNDQLILTAIDDEGNVYQGVKNVPEGGFKKSMYYYGDCELVWKEQQIQKVMPTVTRSDGGDEDELVPNNAGLFLFADDSENPQTAKITISGNSTGCNFWFKGSAEVTLTGNGTAIFDADDDNYMYAEGDLTIVLGSDYTVICPNYDPAIVSKKNLKLKTTGNVQTLTVTTNDYEDVFGICGRENYDNLQYTSLSALEADGFTITRSEVTKNEDGYTWVYTITPPNKQQYESKSW